jgi:Winged helix DNA-binding domain
VPTGPPSVSADQALAWRLQRHYLTGAAASTVAEVVDRLCGVQAQVFSAADLAVRVRMAESSPGDVAQALAEGRIFKTWAMRGTLHLLTVETGRDLLALMASGRSWERPSWQRYFGMTPSEMEALRAAVHEVLAGAPLTREQLIAAVTARPGLAHAGEQLRSGWGTLLKPAAWHGLLAFGPNQGTRVTFVRTEDAAPGWPGLPPQDEAAPRAIAAYLGAYGPATAETFSTWLAGGFFSRKQLRTWFGEMGDRVAAVAVDGQPQFILREHVDELLAAQPGQAVRLLPGFDQWVLGPTTRNAQLLDPGRRANVSRTAGWIAPIVIGGGRIRGTWEARDGRLSVEWFAEAGAVPRRPLLAETERIAALTGTPLDLSTKVV